MPRVATQPSYALAGLLKRRRREMKLSLREVQARTAALGRSIPFTTLNRVEQGKIDPGIRRLRLLLQVYEVSLDTAGELLDLEEYGDAQPSARTSVKTLHKEGLRRFKAGDVHAGLGYLLALRHRTEKSRDRADRQKALVSFAVAVGSMGKYRLSQQIVNDLLIEPPVDELLVSVLVQAAVCWHWLGSGEAALGFLARAEANLEEDDEQQRAWVHHERASALATMGRIDAARRELAKALKAYRAAEDYYGENRAMAVRVRLALREGNPKGALDAARRAREHAEAHEFVRLGTMRLLDEGRTAIEAGEAEAGLQSLDAALAEAIAAKDTATRFYAHHALWKACLRMRDARRAALELQSAKHYVRSVDELTPEAIEIRQLLDR